jgi:hypothetical protein
VMPFAVRRPTAIRGRAAPCVDAATGSAENVERKARQAAELRPTQSTHRYPLLRSLCGVIRAGDLLKLAWVKAGLAQDQLARPAGVAQIVGLGLRERLTAADDADLDAAVRSCGLRSANAT